jgi:hypothetical protein
MTYRLDKRETKNELKTTKLWFTRLPRMLMIASLCAFDCYL